MSETNSTYDEGGYLTTTQLIEKHNESLSQDSQNSLSLPENIDLIEVYCWTGCDLKQAKKENKSGYESKSGTSVKYFDSLGKGIQKKEIKSTGPRFLTKKTAQQVDLNNVFKITFFYAFQQEPNEDGTVIKRRYTEVQNCGTKEHSVIVEHIRVNPNCRSDRKRSRKAMSSRNGQSNSVSTIEQTYRKSNLSNGNSSIPFDKIGIKEEKMVYLADCNPSITLDNQERIETEDDKKSKEITKMTKQFEDTIDISPIDVPHFKSFEKSNSYSLPNKKECHTGDVVQSVLELEKIVYMSETSNTLDDKLYVREWENLGPVQILSSVSTLFTVAEEYKNKADEDWKNIKESRLRLIWSIPYLVTLSEDKCILMFVLTNHNRKQFKMKAKLLNEDVINKKLSLPISFNVEIQLRRSIDEDFGDHLFDPVVGLLKCEELDKYSSTEILIPFERDLGDQFPSILIRMNSHIR